MKTETKISIFKWLYRSFCYYVPAGLTLWTFLIESMINKELTMFDKLSVSGIFAFVCIVIIGVYFYGRHLQKSIDTIRDKLENTINETDKRKLIEEKLKFQGKQEIFKNACFLAPFVIGAFVMALVEAEVVSLRGILTFVSISMAGGMGFNCVQQYLIKKNIK